MFLGFPLFRSLSTIPVEAMTLNALMNSYFGEQKVDLEGSKELDTYSYTVNGITYCQKTYRLRNGSIYVSTNQVEEASIVELQKQLKEAIIEQNFEKAASLRDELKRKMPH